MKHIIFSFAGFYCRIEGTARQISYIGKCYSKSPFAAHMVRTASSGNESASLHVQVISKQNNHIDWFELESSPDRMQFTLRCTENVFLLFPIIEQVLRKIFYILFFKRDGFVLHASAIVRNGKAYLFLGRSGAGKSTAVRLLKQENPSIDIIADNNVFIRKQKDTFLIFPPAFLEWNLSQEMTHAPTGYPVRAVFFLRRYSHPCVEKTNVSMGYRLCYSQVQIPEKSLSIAEIARCKTNLLRFVASIHRNGLTGFLSVDLSKNIRSLVFRE
jgi:hypothetical protein